MSKKPSGMEYRKKKKEDEEKAKNTQKSICYLNRLLKHLVTVKTQSVV